MFDMGGGRHVTDRFLTTGEVAQYCQVSPVTIFRWIKEGKMPAHSTAGGHYRVRATDLLAFLARHSIPVDTDLRREVANEKRILVVDDEQPIVETVVRNLQRLGKNFRFATAFNGFDAGRELALFSPDLIVLDLMMPGVDGLEVCRQVKGELRTQHTKILVITGYSSPDQLQSARMAGADDCLAKPFTGQELRRRVSLLLGMDLAQESAPFPAVAALSG
jgi:excisionase family DNA binding protein